MSILPCLSAVFTAVGCYFHNPLLHLRPNKSVISYTHSLIIISSLFPVPTSFSFRRPCWRRFISSAKSNLQICLAFNDGRYMWASGSWFPLPKGQGRVSSPREFYLSPLLENSISKHRRQDLGNIRGGGRCFVQNNNRL